MADINQQKYEMPEVSLGERLISYFFIVWVGFGYGVLPLITLYFLVIFLPDSGNFFSKFVYCLGLVYLFGGFFVLTTKLWGDWEINYGVLKKGKWKSQPGMKKMFYKVVLPEGFSKPLDSFKPMWDDINGLNLELRNRHEKMVLGKSYYDIAFDYLIRDGKTELYFMCVLKRTDFVFNIIKLYFPEIKFVETTDPYKDIDGDWEPGQRLWGKYRQIHAFDCELRGDQIDTLRDPATIPNNPMDELLVALRGLDKDLTVALQYALRPYPNIYRDQWMAKLMTIKAKESAESGTLYTEKTLAGLNNKERKIKEKHFRVRLKVVVFLPKQKEYLAGDVEKVLKVFFLQTGAGGMLQKDWETSTNRTFVTFPPLSFLDSLIGPFANNLYFKKEVQFRAKMHIDGLKGRGLDVSHDHDSRPFFLCTWELCSILGFPNFGIFTEELEDKTKQVLEEKESATQETKASSFDKLSQLRQKVLNEEDLQTAQPLEKNLSTGQ